MNVSTETATGATVVRRTGTINICNGTHIGVWEEHVDKPAMVLVLRGVLARLRKRGFTVERDPETVKHYPVLADITWTGRKGGLEFIAETRGRTVTIEFFQNVANVENRHGGRYDFDKFKRMPRSMCLPCVVEMAAVVRKLLGYGYTLKEQNATGEPLPRLVLRAAEDDYDNGGPLARFNRKWTAARFARDETGWPTVAEYSNYNNDRDGKPLRNGMERYFRHWNGRLLRGTAYTSMNNMWTIAAADGSYLAHVAGFELFSCERPDLEPRRLKLGQDKRLRAEIDKAVKTEDWGRVAVLGGVLKRFATVMATGAQK